MHGWLKHSENESSQLESISCQDQKCHSNSLVVGEKSAICAGCPCCCHEPSEERSNSMCLGCSRAGMTSERQSLPGAPVGMTNRSALCLDTERDPETVSTSYGAKSFSSLLSSTDRETTNKSRCPPHLLRRNARARPPSSLQTLHETAGV